MKNLVNYIWPTALILIGLSIMVSPTGKVPRIPYEFREYKYFSGVMFLIVGGLLFYGFKKKSNKD